MEGASVSEMSASFYGPHDAPPQNTVTSSAEFLVRISNECFLQRLCVQFLNNLKHGNVAVFSLFCAVISD
jgi:hypothetical protein